MKRPTPVEPDPRAAQADDAETHRADVGQVIYGLAGEPPAEPSNNGDTLVLLPNPKPANDESLDLPATELIDAMLGDDPSFVAVCAARRDAWIAALEAEAANQQHDDATAPPDAKGND